MDTSKRIADALNSAVILGFDGPDSDNLQELIHNYFTERPCDTRPNSQSSDEESSDSDSDESVPLELGFGNEEEELMSVDSDTNNSQESDVEETEANQVINDLAQDVINVIGLDDCLAEDDEQEMAKIRAKKCRCKNPAGGLGCSHKFDDAYVFKLRYQIHALPSANKDMFLMGKIASGGVKTSRLTQQTKRTNQTERKVNRTKGYSVDGISVCRNTFLFMHMTSDKLLTKLVNCYLTNGIEVPQKRSGGASYNKNAFSAEDVIQAVQYITNYGEKNGMVIPGRVAGVKTADYRVRLLPSSDSKSRVWRGYKTHFEELNEATGHNFRLMKRSSFHKIWRKYTPFVLTTRPRTDLCWTCQKHNRQIYHSANETEEEKGEKLQKQAEHLRVVKQERELYQRQVDEAKAAVLGEDIALGPHQQCSRKGTMHYSFDFAQQVHFPNDPDQPGPMYFLTPRKCAVFGINCEAFPEQVNFLIDEGMSISKGSNAVLSYLHFFFNNYGLGEDTVRLHCDNCSGQNKNKFVMWYFAWRCIHMLHKSINLHFLIAGHTKFSPDWCFGLFKQRYRRSHITSLSDIEEAVRSSSYKGINIPQLVGTEDGRVLVDTFDWHAYLSPYFKPLPQIKTYHQMRFDSEHPGVIFAKAYADSEEIKFQVLKNPDVLPPLQLPEPMSPPGLPEQRIRYLYQHIRQFCAQDNRADLTCPMPTA